MIRQSVTLQVRDSGQDAFGQPVTTWTDVKALGANISTVSLSEALRLGREIHTTVLRFEFNRSPTSLGITPDHRINYDGSLYYVISRDSTDRREAVAVIAEELV